MFDQTSTRVQFKQLMPGSTFYPISEVTGEPIQRDGPWTKVHEYYKHNALMNAEYAIYGRRNAGQIDPEDIVQYVSGDLLPEEQVIRRLQGTVHLFNDKNFGIVETKEGKKFFFHPNAAVKRLPSPLDGLFISFYPYDKGKSLWVAEFIKLEHDSTVHEVANSDIQILGVHAPKVVAVHYSGHYEVSRETLAVITDVTQIDPTWTETLQYEVGVELHAFTQMLEDLKNFGHQVGWAVMQMNFKICSERLVLGGSTTPEYLIVVQFRQDLPDTGNNRYVLKVVGESKLHELMNLLEEKYALVKPSDVTAVAQLWSEQHPIDTGVKKALERASNPDLATFQRAHEAIKIAIINFLEIHKIEGIRYNVLEIYSNNWRDIEQMQRQLVKKYPNQRGIWNDLVELIRESYGVLQDKCGPEVDPPRFPEKAQIDPAGAVSEILSEPDRFERAMALLATRRFKHRDPN